MCAGEARVQNESIAFVVVASWGIDRPVALGVLQNVTDASRGSAAGGFAFAGNPWRVDGARADRRTCRRRA